MRDDPITCQLFQRQLSDSRRTQLSRGNSVALYRKLGARNGEKRAAARPVTAPITDYKSYHPQRLQRMHIKVAQWDMGGTTTGSRCHDGTEPLETILGPASACHGNGTPKRKRPEMKSRPLLFRPRHLLYLARREILRMSPPLPRRVGRRTFVVFDPSLLAFHGHHLEFAQLIKEELQSDFDVRFYCNLRAPLKIVRSLPARPVCDVGLYPVVEDFDDAYRSNTALTVRALNRIDADDLNGDTILLVHTLTLYQLGGLSRWLTTLRDGRRPSLCIQFQFPLEFLLPAEPSVRTRAISLAKDAARALAATGRVRFASNSELLADRISKQLGVPCAVLPLPVRWPKRQHTPSPVSGVVFGFFGGLRPEKGSTIIAQTVPAFAARYPDTKFIIHAPPSGSDFSASAALAHVPRVELLRQTFVEKHDYFEQFARANCILLPYDSVQYEHRTSGILIEAVGLGRPVITTKDSWLQAEAERRGGKVFAMNEFSSDALFESLQVAREYLRTQQATPSLKRDVIDGCSAAAFCSAIVQLADRPLNQTTDGPFRRPDRANAN